MTRENEYLQRIAVLEAENAHLREQIAALQQTVLRLEAKIAELEGKASLTPAPPWVPQKRAKKRKKKNGRKKGHEGTTREKPVEIDDTVECRAEECPCCGASLSEDDIIGTREHIQEDIPKPVRPRVTYFRQHTCRCPECDAVVPPPLAEGELPHQAHLGPNLLSLSVWARHHWCLPFRKIVDALKILFGVRVSGGALVGMVDRASNWLRPEYEALIQRIRASPYVHVDETGFRVEGKGWWNWAFVTRDTAVFKLDRRRGSQVALGVLGDTYQGTAISDFMKAYCLLPYRRQVCWQHHLREVHEVSKNNKSDEFRSFRRKTLRLYAEAMALRAKRRSLTRRTYEHRTELLQRRIAKMAHAEHEDSDCTRLAKRMRTHEPYWLTFLREPLVEPGNNRVEREIRPVAVFRKVTGGSRSEKIGATTSVLQSLLHTARLRGIDAFQWLSNAIRHYAQGHTELLGISANTS